MCACVYLPDLCYLIGVQCLPGAVVKEEAVNSRGSSEQGEGEMEVDSNDEQGDDSETKQGGNFSQNLSALSSLKPGLFSLFFFNRTISFMLCACLSLCGCIDIWQFNSSCR